MHKDQNLMIMRSTTGWEKARAVGGIIQVFVSAPNPAARMSEQNDKGRGGLAEKEIRFFYDPKPERGVPMEAIAAGTTRDEPRQPNESKGNIAFGIVRDLKDYGPLRNVIHGS